MLEPVNMHRRGAAKKANVQNDGSLYGNKDLTNQPAPVTDEVLVCLRRCFFGGVGRADVGVWSIPRSSAAMAYCSGHDHGIARCRLHANGRRRGFFSIFGAVARYFSG